MTRTGNLPSDLRNHATDEHARGCPMRTASCECAYEDKTGRLLRAAANRIEELEAILRGRRERAALERKQEP